MMIATASSECKPVTENRFTDARLADILISTYCVSKLSKIAYKLPISPPSTASQLYELEHRTHSLQLPEHSTHLSDCNFLRACYTKTRWLATYAILYFLFYFYMLHFVSFCLWPAFWHAIINEYSFIHVSIANSQRVASTLHDYTYARWWHVGFRLQAAEPFQFY